MYFRFNEHNFTRIGVDNQVRMPDWWSEIDVFTSASILNCASVVAYANPITLTAV